MDPYCSDDSILVCSGIRSMREGMEPVLKLTPSLSKYSAKIPCVPLLDSSVQEAEIVASSEALPAFLTPVWYSHANESPEDNVGAEAFQ